MKQVLKRLVTDKTCMILVRLHASMYDSVLVLRSPSCQESGHKMTASGYYIRLTDTMNVAEVLTLASIL